MTDQKSKKKEGLDSIYNTLEAVLALCLENAGYKDHEDMDGEDFQTLLRFVESYGKGMYEKGKEEGYKNGWQDAIDYCYGLAEELSLSLKALGAKQ